MKEDKFQEMTLCDDCPVLNTDYEQGSECNLGADTELLWTPRGKLVHASRNCELVGIFSREGEFRPEKVMVREKRTDGYVPDESTVKLGKMLRELYEPIMRGMFSNARRTYKS